MIKYGDDMMNKLVDSIYRLDDDNKIDEIIERLSDVALYVATNDRIDSSLTEMDLIESGIDMAIKAAGRQIWRVNDLESYNFYYFAGTYDEVLYQIKKAING